MENGIIIIGARLLPECSHTCPSLQKLLLLLLLQNLANVLFREFSNLFGPNQSKAMARMTMVPSKINEIDWYNHALDCYCHPCVCVHVHPFYLSSSFAH
jgi:hypothetical protein